MNWVMMTTTAIAAAERIAELITYLGKQQPDNIPKEQIAEINNRIKTATAKLKAAIAKRKNLTS